jgi:hypothetical protein
MIGNYNNSGIPRLRSHKQALEWYEDTKPIRGRDKDTRPLGRRASVDNYHISKADNGDIVCNLWKSPSVTFHQDDTMTIHYGRNSFVMMGMFIQQVLGVWAGQEHNMFTVNTISGRSVIPKEGLKVKFVYDPHFGVEAFNSPVTFVHHIKRKEKQAVLNKYQGIRDYLTGFVKVREYAYTEPELKMVFGVTYQQHTDQNGKTQRWESIQYPRFSIANSHDVEQMFAWLESEEASDNYKGALAIMWECSPYEKRNPKIHKAMAVLDDYILARHKHEVFKEIQVPEGTIRRDNYGKFFI